MDPACRDGGRALWRVCAPQSHEKEKAVSLGRQWLDKATGQQEVASFETAGTASSRTEEDGYRQLLQRTEAAVGYFIRLLDEEAHRAHRTHISELRVKQKTKKYLQEMQALTVLCVRKKQQVEDALNWCKGYKGVAAGELLSGGGKNLAKSREVLNGAAGDSTGHGVGGASTGSSAEMLRAKSRKGETNRISLGMFREGIAIEEIAGRRDLSVSTIEGHLASFIGTGEVDIKELVPEHKIGPILDAIKAVGATALGPIRSRLGDDYSFGEIKAVLQHLAASLAGCRQACNYSVRRLLTGLAIAIFSAWKLTVISAISKASRPASKNTHHCKAIW